MAARRKQSATVDIKIRMKEPLRAEVERAAKQRDVSMNAEMVDRLEQSFHSAGALNDALDMAYGKQGAALTKLFGRLMRGAPAAYGLTPDDDWLNDPTAYDRVAKALVFAFDALRPPGKPVSVAGETAEHYAARLLIAAGDETPNHVWSEWAKSVRDGLGPQAARRVIAWVKSRTGSRHLREEHE